MEPLTPEQTCCLQDKTCEAAESVGLKPIGGWLFTKDGIVYDLSTADLNRLDHIIQQGLFVVELPPAGWISNL